MVHSNPILGTLLHAIGGASASTCYLPNHKTQRWSWGTFWLVQATFAWLIMPLVVGYFTVPEFFYILKNAPTTAFWSAFLLGGVYGFGGMSFGYAIRNIGYSLTYTIGIGISAVLGTLTPIMMRGQVAEYFSRPGSGIVLIGMILSVVGVSLCGFAGFKKERDLGGLKNAVHFNMKVGLTLAIIAGILSAVLIFHSKPDNPLPIWPQNTVPEILKEMLK